MVVAAAVGNVESNSVVLHFGSFAGVALELEQLLYHFESVPVEFLHGENIKLSIDTQRKFGPDIDNN